MDKMAEKGDKRKVHKVWKHLTFVLGAFSLVLLIAISVAVVIISRKKSEHIPDCFGIPASGPIDLTEPDSPPAFHDLTREEIQTILDFMYSLKKLNLTEPPNATIDSNYIYSVELVLPKKSSIIQPYPETLMKRRALVTIFKGANSKPDVLEYRVDITSSPPKLLSTKSVPFSFRPLSFTEFVVSESVLKEECRNVVGDILQQSFGGNLLNCGNKCLGIAAIVPFPSHIAGIRGQGYRAMWALFLQMKEPSDLHPVDFAVLLRMNGTARPETSDVWYNNRLFDSLKSFKEKWYNGEVAKQRVDFPPSHTHTEVFPEYPQRPPIEVEPDGKRYTIKDRKVTYMNWNFQFGISITHGPQLYQIKFKDTLIVYELGLQEILVFYSSSDPSRMFANYFDSLALIGDNIRTLVPGVDCPNHATFIDFAHMSELSRAPVTESNAICVFEHNTGIPLRRHHGLYEAPSGYYEGVPNIVLILRMITTISNYDYIFDFIFYQNGVLETKVTSTGIILTSPMISQRKYGFQLNDRSIGTIHHHMFHFKVDIDIGDSINSYSTFDIERDSIENQFSREKNPDKWHQEKIVQVNYATEREAAYKFNFSIPKYHVFYSEDDTHKDKFGNRRAYRLLHRGLSKSGLQEGYGNEPGASWMRYQMAVTKRKETEPYSSSKYASFDGEQPTVDFEGFIGDENIQKEDLVAWVTMGTHHIPHTEDLPVVTTPGTDVSFLLLPFNFFHEDPSIGIRDNIRIHYENIQNPSEPLTIKRQTKAEDLNCLPPKTYSLDDLKVKPEAFISRMI
ncbi:putative amine oxidase [copper-containing] [Saccostrea cucullata]|uniref:putative amine oxidase [copper-containing] n=1 Tax=Saccostrea cuccullata TaxID=36930 RepID=UPI002ED15FFC